jgi:hypothetical protein
VQLQSNRAPRLISSAAADKSEPRARPAQGLAAAVGLCSGPAWLSPARDWRLSRLVEYKSTKLTFK